MNDSKLRGLGYGLLLCCLFYLSNGIPNEPTPLHLVWVVAVVIVFLLYFSEDL